ncbi:MAG: hypothetical protein Q8R88_08600 [Desulfoprunum sp.]|nr:hypothetical protein [Desulfoprunum sp.]
MQVDAITNDRRLIETVDPLPDLVQSVANELRTTFKTAEKAYAATYNQGMSSLTGSENWQKLTGDQPQSLLHHSSLAKIDKGPVGCVEEVLFSLNRINLESWSP